MSQNIDKSIFKAYDIRGVYGEGLFDELADKIGRAFSVVVEPETVIVGRDARISSPVLHEQLIKGLRAVGVNVIDIDMVSTDMYYYACATKGLPGIMVTASHNPKEYNGFKMVKKIPQLLSGEEGIQDIYQLIAEDKLPANAETEGSLESWDIMDEFIDKIMSLADSSKFKPMKLVVDTSNGMVGPSFVELFKKIPQVEYIPMYFEPDGTFPNHGGDPLKEENRRELQERVVSEGADLGITFDPDGDRFFCIDSTGRFVSGDFMTAIMAQYFLEKNPGASIVYDIRASHAVPNLIEEAGGKSFYNRVGHAFIKKRMMEEDAVFGGEVTGHYYFKDYFMCDSGLAPVMYLLDLLSHKEETLAEIVDELEKIYFISGEINTKGVDKNEVFKKIEEKYGPDAKEIIRVDGITLLYDGWHFNVRASNTEPLVRLNLEADSKELMEEKRDEILAVIRS